MGQFSCPMSKDAKRQEKIRQDNTFPSRRHDKPGMSYKGNGRSMLVEQKKNASSLFRRHLSSS